MSALPRSIRLAAWGAAVLAGTADVGRAVRAVTGDDEPHLVAGPAPAWLGVGEDDDLAALLATLARAGCGGLVAVLPVPGDPVGLPGPPAFNETAVDAGECVLIVPPPGGEPAGLVPEITEFGSVWEPGATVTWRLCATGPRPAAAVSLPEAEQALRTAVRETADELAGLDVARWRSDAADRIAAARAGADPGPLPAGTAARAVRVLAMAAQVNGIVGLALEDDGAAVTGFEAQRRTAALRTLASACRQAMVAAVNDGGGAG